MRVGDADHGHVAERRRVRRAGGVTSSAAAPAATAPQQVVVAVGPLAGQRDEQVARADRAGVDGAAADGPVGAGQQPAAGQADEVVGGRGPARADPASRPASRRTATVVTGPRTGADGRHRGRRRAAGRAS